MKQQKTFSLVAFALLQAALLLSACSSEENIPASGGIAVTDAHINISVAPFETSSGKAKTRAEGTDETKADTVLLANGMRAICTVEEDDEAEQTRAPKPIADGHYTIYACDPVTGNRITGPDKLLKGTVTGGVFQSDGGTRLFLDPGTYKFVCINDAVEDNGTHLIINTGCYSGPTPTYTPSAGDAQIGTATETISGDNWQVNFTMHHQNTRVRLHVIAYSDHMDDPWGFVAGSLNAAFGRQYNIDGTSPVVTMRVPTLSNYYLSCFKMPATSTNYNATYVRAHDFYSDYMYLTPGVDIVASNIGFDINSHLYGKQIPGNGFNKQIDALQNHSYTVTYRILPDALYLFQDGTCGAYSEKGSRTAIAAVVKEKTNTEEGTAMALRDADGGTSIYYGQWGSRMFVYNNTKQYEQDFSDAADDMDGYKWTYDPAGSADGTVKANNNSDYTMFYYAASYNPGISPVAPTIGKWYLPAMGEWMQAFTSLTGKTFQQGTTAYGGHIQYIDDVDIAKLNKCFEDAGGTGLVTQSGGVYTNRDYWTSSEIKPFYLNHPVARFDFSGGQRKICIAIGSKHNGSSPVRPFVHF